MTRLVLKTRHPSSMFVSADPYRGWSEAKREVLGYASTQGTYPILGTSDWRQVRTEFTVPAGTAEVSVRAGIAALENNGGQAWFDDVCVRELR